MDEEDTELRNPYPSPPSHYTKYASHNLNLLQILHQRSDDPSNANQYEVLADQTDIPDWPLVQLEKPGVDWILEDEEPYYDVFGDRWFVKDKILSLADSGGTQLYSNDPSVDRRPALRSVLRSLLASYSALTGALLKPPPTSPDVQPEWVQHLEWINVLSQNLMAAANDLRPVQARGNLETMMARQLQLRREETRSIHNTCDELEKKLKQLRTSLSLPTPTKISSMGVTVSTGSATDVDHAKGLLTALDVQRWAEEVI